MPRRSMLLCLACFTVCTAASRSQVPRLAIQGQPFFDGNLVLHVIDEQAVGSVPFLGLGIDPLDPPLQTPKGSFYIGTLMLALPLSPVPSSGHLDVPLAMPPYEPLFVGVHVVAQALIDGKLTNPASVPFDLPYKQPMSAVVLTSPTPASKANFGHRLTTGDLDGDGVTDLVVSAWFETVSGFEKAGRVYVLFGPDYTASSRLSPSAPKEAGVFGQCIEVADMTGDGVDDLVVTETGGDPWNLGNTGTVHLFVGGAPFSSHSALQIPSPGTGLAYTAWGSGLAVADFDDDGDRDIAVANPGEEFAGLPKAGRIDIYHGPTFTTLVEIGSPTPVAADAFGLRLASGDVNGDGISDLVESSCGVDVDGVSNIGAGHVMLGPDLTTVIPIDNPLPAGPQTCFGTWVVADDLDGDGACDVILTDFLGRVFVFWGPDATTYHLFEKPPTMEPNPFGEFAWGNDVDVADVNGDGFRDLVIGDPYGGEIAGCGIVPEGSVYVALGPFYETYCRLTDKVAQCGEFFGWSVRAVDLDGDSSPEIIAGNDIADEAGLFNAGHVTILY